MAVHAGPDVITNGLIVNLDAGNSKSYPGSGTTWIDLSGNARNGSLVNSPTFITDNSGAFTFDGANTYISSTFDLSWNNTNSVTIFVTLRPSTLSQWRPFLGKGPSNWEWQLIQNNGNLDFVYWNTGGGHTNGPIPSISNVFISTTSFVNICMVWNHVDNKYYFYRNGSLINTTNWTDASINQNRTDGINIGGNLYKWSMPGNYWSGSISNIQIYNRALSDSETIQNFNALRGRYGI